MLKERILEPEIQYSLNTSTINPNKYRILHKPITLMVSISVLVMSGKELLTQVVETDNRVTILSPSGNNNIYLGEYNAMNTLSGLEVFSMDKIIGMNAINEVRKLQFNWNGNNAEPFSETVLQKSTMILNNLEYVPDIYPTACNSIQFEYEKVSGEYLEFEIFDTFVNVFKINSDKTEEEFEENDFNNLKKLVNEFYG